MMIPFNKPYLTGNELLYISQAVSDGHISGNGKFTKKCHRFFEENYGYKKCLLTTSCTDALEMAAILLEIKEGDEVIMPSFTFVSTANAFVLRGARIVFADSHKEHPGIDEAMIEGLINENTKAIVPVHYAGVACDMDKIMCLAKKYDLFIVEDAAQSIDSFYKGRPLGSIGDLATFSFHETKNIQCGEGGMLVINNENLIRRAEIVWEKGTNRADFIRGEVSKYEWVDIGSSYLPSELNAAFLFAQLENIKRIQGQRSKLWNLYYEKLSPLSESKRIKLPFIPDYSANNYHLFYILLNSLHERADLIAFMKENYVNTIFHYQSLHKSPYYYSKHKSTELLKSDYYSDQLLRLPLFYDLEDESIDYIIQLIFRFFS